MEHIRVQNVTKTFRSGFDVSPIIASTSFTVEAGEIVAIVGKSGCGKSTLLHLLGGLEAPTSGDIQICGTVTLVPQKDLLLPWRTVLQNCILPIEIVHGNIHSAKKKALALLQQYGLISYATQLPSFLSGGMRQRVGLIRAIIHNTDITLLDEPFSALDYDARLTIGKELRKYMKEKNKTVIFVTHNIEEAILLSDRVIVFSGKPCTIVLNKKIDLKESLRDTVRIRRTPLFNELFETIWNLIAAKQTYEATTS